MPIRMLRDWTDSSTLDGVSAEGERLFVRLIMKADDYGRFHADLRLVRALCFPLSETVKAEAVRKWLNELIEAGLVFTYEVEKKPLLAVVNFGQRLKQSRAKFPEPEGESHDWMPTSGNFRELPGNSGNSQEVAGSSGLNRTRIEHEKEHDSAPSGADGFDSFWQAYPKRRNKGDALKAWKKAIKTTTLETVLESIERQKQSEDWKKEGGQFIPYPASWINAEGWHNETSPSIPKQANGSNSGHVPVNATMPSTAFEQMDFMAIRRAAKAKQEEQFNGAHFVD